MSNLMVYPAEIAEMTVNQLAALPHAKLVEATTNLDELLKWAKENRQKRIVAAGEPLSEYIDVEFSVSEKRFSAWPTNMKEQFVEARTVKGGKPAIKVEFNGVEVQ